VEEKIELQNTSQPKAPFEAKSNNPAKWLFLSLIAIVLLCSSFELLADTSDQEQPAKRHTATFAGGCFWCMVEPFEKLEGVREVSSGYIGGETSNPTYKEVTAGDTGHFEAVQIIFDPDLISYQKLLDVFWKNIDPTDGSGQFCDRGPQYRSAIFTHSEEQKNLAKESKHKIAELLEEDIETELLDTSVFYPAEAYHQRYYKRNPKRYKYYRWRCGRDKRLNEIWGEQ